MVDKCLKVVLVEDHALVRAGIRSLLDDIKGLEVVAEAKNGRHAQEIVKKYRPDVVLMDIAMPELNGIDATSQITQEHEDIRVIILSMYANEEYVLQALQAGASGYLLKDSDVEELELAIKIVGRGATYLTPSISEHVISYVRRAGETRSPLDRLTHRQREILQLIAEGNTSKQIALKLYISPKTVETHRSMLMEKIGAQDIQALMRFAIHSGIISSD